MVRGYDSRRDSGYETLQDGPQNDPGARSTILTRPRGSKDGFSVPETVQPRKATGSASLAPQTVRALVRHTRRNPPCLDARCFPLRGYTNREKSARSNSTHCVIMLIPKTGIRHTPKSSDGLAPRRSRTRSSRRGQVAMLAQLVSGLVHGDR